MKNEIFFLFLLSLISIFITSCYKEEVILVIMISNNNNEVEMIEMRDDFLLPHPDHYEGYSFEGWYFDPTFENEYDVIYIDNYIRNHRLVVYAKWLPQCYQVTFETYWGSDIPNQKVCYNEPITVPDHPTLDGYIFMGWYLDINYEQKATQFIMPNGDFVLYAKWEPTT